MMLVVDPDEVFPLGTVNDGGARFVRSCPRTPAQTVAEPVFANGRVISASFGPSRQTPALSYFSVDLTSAYSEKIKDYVRTFCFLNLGSSQTPAVLIVLDFGFPGGSLRLVVGQKVTLALALAAPNRVPAAAARPRRGRGLGR